MNHIFNQLKDIGIVPGDTVFINCNLEEFGLIEGYKRINYVNLFLDYLGKSGTLMALSYTSPKFSIFSNKDIPVFDGTQKATTGAFSNAMLSHPDSIRTNHPSHSVVVNGKYARLIVDNLNKTDLPFSFAHEIIKLNGKVLLIGMADYPGFITHTVEQDLQLYKKYWIRYFIKVKVNNKIKRLLYPGGCSSTFGKLYQEYIKRYKLRMGIINNGYSLCINAKDAYKIDMEVISKNPELLLCNNPHCLSCRVGRWSNIWKLPLFTIRRKIKKYLG